MRFENVTLQSGVMLPHLDLVYNTFGKLNTAGDNCILLPTYYGGTHVSYAQVIGRARALNPSKYFIVIPNILGNGVSSSPSNMPAPFHGAEFPHVTIADNVRLQYQLLTEKLNVKQIALIYGWSLGAMQGFAWAVAYPEMVRRLLAVCGSAKCWPLNDAFLQSALGALTSDANFLNGHYTLKPEAGLRAIGRCFTAWGYSAAFYRDQLYRNLGYESSAALMKFGEEFNLAQDANNLLSVLWAWRNVDTELEDLKKITAQTIVMPCDQDMYFTMEEARLEAEQIPNAEFRPMYSPYGHCAGIPGWVSVQTVFLEQAIRDLLAR